MGGSGAGEGEQNQLRIPRRPRSTSLPPRQAGRRSSLHANAAQLGRAAGGPPLGVQHEGSMGGVPPQAVGSSLVEIKTAVRIPVS